MSEHPPTPPGTFRVGHDIPRNLYDGDKDIGRIDTAEYAAQIVEALNGSRELQGQLAEVQAELAAPRARAARAVISISRLPCGSGCSEYTWLIEAENHSTRHGATEDALQMLGVLMREREEVERDRHSR